MGDKREEAQDNEQRDDDPQKARAIICALDSFRQYARVAHRSTHLRRNAFYALPRAHWEKLAAEPFNYLKTLDRIDEAIDQNALLAREIAKYGLVNFRAVELKYGEEPVFPKEWEGSSNDGDAEKARSTLSHFFRDWTAAGAVEREACYKPVIDACKEQQARHEPGYKLNVLVPGAGLARLVFDLCMQGHNVEGSEISYHSLIACHYVLNAVTEAEQHTIFPWVHKFSDHRTRNNQLRGYGVPEMHPSTTMVACPNFGGICITENNFPAEYDTKEYEKTFDVVGSVFFLDTARNPIRYLETAFHCLKPGGILVNFGPLFWPACQDQDQDHDGNRSGNGNGEHQAGVPKGIADPGSFELAEDELIMLVESTGFKVVKHETGLHAPYITDIESMRPNQYRGSLWIARKPVLDTKFPVRTCKAPLG